MISFHYVSEGFISCLTCNLQYLIFSEQSASTASFEYTHWNIESVFYVLHKIKSILRSTKNLLTIMLYQKMFNFRAKKAKSRV